MKKRFCRSSIFVFTCALAVPCLLGHASPSMKIAAGDAASTDTRTFKGKTASARFKPFYVYSEEKSSKNHYVPSGWMGDTRDIAFSVAHQVDPKIGKTCVKVVYTGAGPKGWAGIYWQNPANNWGTSKGGYDLRGARYLTFWARGEKGGEKISEIKMGGITGKFADSDIAWTGPLKLKKKWTSYRIDLNKKDLRYISGGFCFTVLKADNPHGCTFYLDEMRYE